MAPLTQWNPSTQISRGNISVGVAPVVADINAPTTAELTTGTTSSDLTRLWSLAHRRSILNDSTVTDELVGELARHVDDSGAARDRLFVTLHNTLGISNRQIASLTGVRHPTVAAGIKRAEGAQHGGPAEQ